MAINPDVPVLAADGKMALMPVDRRRFLLAIGAAGVATAAGDAFGVEWGRIAGTIRAPERVDVEIVGYLQRVLDEHHTADKMRGPRHLIDVVATQMRFIDQLRRGARGEVRDELLTVGARYAEFAGWLHQDTGNFHAATYWSDRAMEWAQEAGNHVLVSYVLMRKSNQARDQRDTERVLGLAQAAQRVNDPLPPRACAIATQQEAQGHALAGDEPGCHRRFDDALEMVAIAERDQDRGPGRWCTEVYIELQRANAWTELGHPRRAIELFERELVRLPAAEQRDRGVYLGRKGIAHAAAGDPEQASAMGHEALAIARETGSGRIMTELHRLDARLADWAGLSAVAQFQEALDAG